MRCAVQRRAFFFFGFAGASAAVQKALVPRFAAAVARPRAVPAKALALLSHMLRNGFFLVHGFFMSDSIKEMWARCPVSGDMTDGTVGFLYGRVAGDEPAVCQARRSSRRQGANCCSSKRRLFTIFGGRRRGLRDPVPVFEYVSRCSTAATFSVAESGEQQESGISLPSVMAIPSNCRRGRSGDRVTWHCASPVAAQESVVIGGCATGFLERRLVAKPGMA